MSLAAIDLQSGNEKVIDISLKYGYNLPTSFNRAFKSVHGIAPSQAKEEGTILKAFPPISFKIAIKGDSEMNYRIEKKIWKCTDIEVYLNPDPENAQYKVSIPVSKKEN